MSGGLIYQRALRIVRSSELSELAEGDVVSALEAARNGPVDFAYLAGLDAGLEREDLLARGTAVLFIFAAANLADDMADGDCIYLSARAAPGAQFLLHMLSFHVLSSTGVPHAEVGAAAADLARCAGQQQREVRATEWTFDLAREVALGIAGLQYSAYLRILWAATPLAPRAFEIGCNLGVIAHIAADLVSSDRRICSLPDADRRALLAWTREAMTRLRGVDLECVRAGLRAVGPVLDREP